MSLVYYIMATGFSWTKLSNLSRQKLRTFLQKETSADMWILFLPESTAYANKTTCDYLDNAKNIKLGCRYPRQYKGKGVE